MREKERERGGRGKEREGGGGRFVNSYNMWPDLRKRTICRNGSTSMMKRTNIFCQLFVSKHCIYTDMNAEQKTLYTTCTLHYIVNYNQHTVQ